VEVKEGVLNPLKCGTASKSLPEGMFGNFKTTDKEAIKCIKIVLRNMNVVK